LDGSRAPVFARESIPAPARSTEIQLEAGGPQGTIRRAAMEAMVYVRGREAATFARLAKYVVDNRDRSTAVRALLKVPQREWPVDQADGVLASLLEFLKSLPADARRTPAATDALQLAEALTSTLPNDQARATRRLLRELGVRHLRLGTVPHRMVYDQEQLVVEAGKQVELQFENADIMPHNFVIVDSPAAREEVGIAADRMQTQADALAKGYLPDSPHILHASRLIQPKDTDTLTFSAPAEPGTYAYLCTFPGHWSKMYGALVVTDDAAAYLATHQPLPSADELLGIRTVDWTWEQLTEQLAGLSEGRSFENGQKNFLRASCFSCHQIKAEGGRIGPDLTKIREKYKTPEELLRQIVFPSEKVEEQYATVIIETTNGNVLRGVVVSETETELRINENPLASCEPKVVAKDDIEDLTRSKLSPMPEKLLNTLVDSGDILDLLAYLISGGNPDDPSFQTQ
ncbi:MAG: c-type cytochrome, partial [Planctomycetales bacterium]|nr:c-type cytochrome [Planctomycetales bacterium]